MNYKEKKLLQTYKHRILIVDDDKSIRMLLRKYCKILKIESDTVANGEEALKKIDEHEYSVYIVDLMMPVMDGLEFIPKLQQRHPDAIIIVETATDDADKIVQIMRMGVYDCFIKPVEGEQIKDRIKSALDFKDKLLFQQMIENASSSKMQEQLNWYAYKENILLKEEDNKEYRYLHNLKTTLAQGQGLGTTITLIELMEATAQKMKEGLLVPYDLADMIFQNNKINKFIFDGLDKIINIFKEELNLVRKKSSHIVSLISKILEKHKKSIDDVKISVQISKLKKNEIIEIDEEKIYLVLEELIINAINYSGKNSKIEVYYFYKEGHFCIAIKNDMKDKGIPSEYEKIVFEPFYRINQLTERIIDYQNIALGLGLGLTIVKNIIRKHNGLFFIYNVDDHSEKTTAKRVLLEIHLPYIKE